MKKILALLVVLSTGACMRQVHARPVELPDPAVGDMTCAPPMSIDALLETLHDAAPAALRCDTLDG